MLLGDYIAYSAMLDGKHVAYTPSYGPETRGGKAKCYVVISEGEIDTPIPEEPDLMIIMNQPSMDFVPMLRKEGLLIYNSSIIEGKPQRSDIESIPIPATEIADSLGRELSPTLLGDRKDTRFLANSVLFGAYLGTPAGKSAKGYLDKTLQYFLGGKKESLAELNRFAVQRGYDFMSTRAAGKP